MEHHESFWGNPRTWVGLAFMLFVVLFGRKIWQALSKLLDDHSARIRFELEEASRLRVEAEQILRDAEARRMAAVEEARRLIEGAKAEADRVASAAAEEAEAGSRRREQMALDRIAAAEKAAVDEVRVTAAEVATEAARNVIARGLSADADAGLIDHAIAQLPASLSPRRAA
jgi:F-type H+-transporting ATPase subunit b